MPDTRSLLLLATAVSLALHLRAEYRGPRWQVYLWKPCTTAIVLFLALLPIPAHGEQYRVAVGLGLLCSLVGDVYLMLPGNRFLPGLASFFLAHLAYLAAFSTNLSFGSAPFLLLPLLALGTALVSALWRHLGRKRLPVVVYTLVIILMVWQALAAAWIVGTPGARLAGLGATLFLASDATLAVNRFRSPLRWAQAWIMGSYVAAQGLIALSVGTP